MPLPILPLLLGLADVIPAVTGLFAGARAQEKVEKVAGLVKAVTGQEDLGAGVDAIKANPQLALQLQGMVMQHERDSYIAETARLQVVNETMRAEYASGDKYTSRWRPTFGYAACVTWVLQGLIVFGLVAYMAVMHPDRLPRTLVVITDLMRALADHWMYAMAVLGIAVWKRSEDKKTAAGDGGGGGLLGSIAERFKK